MSSEYIGIRAGNNYTYSLLCIYLSDPSFLPPVEAGREIHVAVHVCLSLAPHLLQLFRINGWQVDPVKLLLGLFYITVLVKPMSM